MGTKRKSSGAIADNEIGVRCKTADRLPWREIEPLQGNYKTRTAADIQKICNLIKKRGIRFPSFVSRIGTHIYAIDTYGRLLAYEKLEKEGWAIPPVPVVYVDAKDKAEAKHLLLECDSRFGKISQEGFFEFAADIEIHMEELSLADIKIDEDAKPIKAIEHKDKTELVIECADDGEAETLYNEFKKRGLKCRISTL